MKEKSMASIFMYIMGWVSIAFWVAVVLDEIQTSEAWLGAPAHASLIPSVYILLQPIQLITGTLAVGWVAPVLVAWIAELFVMAFTFVFEAMMLTGKNHNRFLAKGFGTTSIAAFFYDGWSNYASGFAATGDLIHQLIFTVALAGGAVLLPIIAMGFFKVAQQV